MWKGCVQNNCAILDEAERASTLGTRCAWLDFNESWVCLGRNGPIKSNANIFFFITCTFMWSKKKSIVSLLYCYSQTSILTAKFDILRTFPDVILCALYIYSGLPGACSLRLRSCLRYPEITRDAVCSTFRPQAPPAYTQTQTHSLTPVWSTSAASDGAACMVTSPTRLVVCSGWSSLCSLFLLARLHVPSGERNLCAYEIINRLVAKFADCC